MGICDINGNPIGSGGTSGGTSDFGVVDYTTFTNDNGIPSREAVLTYQGRRLYPKTYPNQVIDFVRDYGGGVMLALGDSYTYMGGGYFNEFAEKHGLVLDNRGMSSSTVAGSDDNMTVGYFPFWKRLDAAIAEYKADGGHTIDGVAYTLDDVKLVTFMGGANDWWTVNDEIDRLGNPESENKEQLHGACKHIFNAMLANFPNADIVVILQPCSASKGNYSMWLKEGIIRDMAMMYSLPICDCCFEWYNPSNPTDAATYWAEDELHMSDAGNEAIFAKLEKVVNNLPFTRNK